MPGALTNKKRWSPDWVVDTGIAFLSHAQEYATPLIVFRMPLSIQLTRRRIRIPAPLPVNGVIKGPNGTAVRRRGTTARKPRDRGRSSRVAVAVPARKPAVSAVTVSLAVNGIRYRQTGRRCDCAKAPRGPRSVRCRPRPGSSWTASAHPDVKAAGAGGGRSNPAGGGVDTRWSALATVKSRISPIFVARLSYDAGARWCVLTWSKKMRSALKGDRRAIASRSALAARFCGGETGRVGDAGRTDGSAELGYGCSTRRLRPLGEGV